MVRTKPEQLTRQERNWIRKILDVYTVGDELTVHDVISTLKDAGITTVPTPQQVRPLLHLSGCFEKVGKRKCRRPIGSLYIVQFYRVVKEKLVIEDE